MKRFLCILAAMATAVAALAQTPEEIVSRMDEAMSKFNANDGVSMAIDIKMPIIGTMSSKNWSRGGKSRMESEVGGVKAIVWDDGVTQWRYNGQKNEIEIENSKVKANESSEPKGDIGLFDGICDGYDLTIEKETDKAWFIKCKKSKSNKDKDSPKKMSLVVAKADYFPISLSMSASGVDFTMRDIAFGVSEKEVTFNQADYPDATIIDKR